MEPAWECTFCGKRGKVVAGGAGAFICAGCVQTGRSALTPPPSGGSVWTVETTGSRCSFCCLEATDERPVAGSAKARICSDCVTVCETIFADP